MTMRPVSFCLWASLWILNLSSYENPLASAQRAAGFAVVTFHCGGGFTPRRVPPCGWLRRQPPVLFHFGPGSFVHSRRDRDKLRPFRAKRHGSVQSRRAVGCRLRLPHHGL